MHNDPHDSYLLIAQNFFGVFLRNETKDEALQPQQRQVPLVTNLMQHFAEPFNKHDVSERSKIINK